MSYAYDCHHFVVCDYGKESLHNLAKVTPLVGNRAKISTQLLRLYMGILRLRVVEPQNP